MANNTPKVSVIIPNYNHAPFIARRIESVLAQTFTDYELIILDDCSTDNSRDIIEKFRGNPKINHIEYNPTNSGSTFPQWNKGIALARGQYIWFAESDDLAKPDFLEQTVAILDQYPTVAIVKCQSEIIDQDNNVLYHFEDKFPHFRSPSKPLPGIADCLQQATDWSGIVNASAVLFKKTIYLQAGGAPENFKLAGDWLTWARMLGHGDIYYLPKTLNQMRLIHTNSARSAHMTSNQTRYLTERFNVIKFILKSYKAPFKTKLTALNNQIREWAKIALNLKAKSVLPLENFKILALAMTISIIALPLTVYHFFVRALYVTFTKLVK